MRMDYAQKTGSFHREEEVFADCRKSFENEIVNLQRFVETLRQKVSDSEDKRNAALAVKGEFVSLVLFCVTSIADLTKRQKSEQILAVLI